MSGSRFHRIIRDDQCLAKAQSGSGSGAFRTAAPSARWRDEHTHSVSLVKVQQMERWSQGLHNGRPF